MITAKQFSKECFQSHGNITPSDLIEFAKIHVEAQREAILKNACTSSSGLSIDKESVEKSYPNKKIK